MKGNEMLYYVTGFRPSDYEDMAEKPAGIWARIRWHFKKIRYKTKLKRMDEVWRMMGGSCFGLFPPSFYETHTEEEIQRITDETMARLRKMVEEPDQRTAEKKE